LQGFSAHQARDSNPDASQAPVEGVGDRLAAFAVCTLARDDRA